MARSVDEWKGATDDAAIPTRVRVRVFERYGGRCYKTGRLIRPGDAWQLDHIIALANGGEHSEANLAPILADAHKAKTSEDVKLKSKIARIRAKHTNSWPKSKTPLRSRGFQSTRPALSEDTP